MEEKDKINLWERRNETLVSKIEEFYIEYEKTHKPDFKENEFKAHQKMLRVAGRVFNNEIESQVSELSELNKNFLAEIFN
jgi:hypothetical protein